MEKPLGVQATEQQNHKGERGQKISTNKEFKYIF